MEKSKLYTRTGDSGTTSLVGGTRAHKACLRLDAYGTLDEFSSFLGALASDPSCPYDSRKQVLEIQNLLFDLGGYLACEVKPGTQPPAWGLSPQKTAVLEEWIDTLDAMTPKINRFVLPGGTPLSSKAHIARAVCRRAERCICRLAQEEYVDPALLAYVNRLSDYLFILARHFNHIAGVEEITWEKQ